jgi:hypothetical protein
MELMSTQEVVEEEEQLGDMVNLVMNFDVSRTCSYEWRTQSSLQEEEEEEEEEGEEEEDEEGVHPLEKLF